jgi:hypothetical protein
MKLFFGRAIVGSEESMSIRAVSALFLALLVPCALSAQASYDPNDGLYRYLGAWEGRGLLEPLPRLRPYSAEVLRALLGEVISRGTADDARIARDLQGELEGVAIHAHASLRSEARDSQYFGRTGLGAHMLVQMHPQASLGGRVDFWAVDGTPDPVQPIGERTDIDLSEDPGSVSVNVLGRELLYRLSSILSLSVGDRSLSLQAGLNRSSFGPFFDNGLVIGPQAPIAGNLIFNWNLDAVRLYYGLFELTQRIPSGGLQTGKYLALHGLELLPLPWLTVDAFEMMVWSGRFEPLYLIPIADFFYTQSLSGFGDNSFVGLMATARISNGLTLKGQLIADDSHKFAGEAGIVWAPASEVLRTVALDYTFVIPYTYTHQPNDLTPPQSIDYTNWGVNEGPALEPDSDRVEVRAFLTPLPSLELTALGRFIRHGNASEDYVGTADGAVHDGTISDPGYVNNEHIFPTGSYFSELPWKALRFLTQSVIDMSLQVGLGAAWRLRVDGGDVRLSARYLFELRFNEGLVSGTTGAHNYISLAATYSF